MGRRRTVLAVLGAVLVASIAAVVAGQLWLRGERDADDRAAAARDAAEGAVAQVLSYDHRRLEAGLDETAPLLTGDAAEQFEALRGPLLEEAPQVRAVVRAEVKSAAVLDADDESARVLLFVDQTSTRAGLEAPELDQSRILVTMVRDGERWLVSTLAAV